MATSRAEDRDEAASTSQRAARPTLIVAALKRELTVIARARRSGAALLETGEGPRNAERALRGWLDAHQARAVINVGMAGALSDSLRVGDVVIAREVRGFDRQFDASTSSLFRRASILADQQVGVAVTVDEVVCTASDKRRLAALANVNEVAWVDMESAAIAAVCDELRIPYLVVRAISDRLNEDLPVDFNRCRDASGRVSTRRVMQAALLRPRAFKGLIELKRRADLCASRLASFVERLLTEMTNDE